MGVYAIESEYCAPTYGDVEEGSKVFFSNKIISVPVLNDEDKLMFTI
jgi:hypothetical protein